MAEALAVVGLISAVVAFVEVGSKFAAKLQYFHQSGKRIPSYLSDVSAQVSLLIEVVEQIREDGESNQIPESTCQCLFQAVKGCSRRTQELGILLEQIAISRDDSRAIRVRKFWRGVLQERKLLDLLRSLEAYKSLISLKLLQDTRRTVQEKTDKVDRGHYHVPPLKVLQFIGRAEALETIAASLRPGSEGGRKIAVLLGMGGAGKTQIALEYCKQAWRDRDYQHIFWVDATSLESIRSSYKTIATEFAPGSDKAQGVSSAVDFVKDIIGSLPTPWLMIYDNFDSPRRVPNIPELLPDGDKIAGAILFTSRHLDSSRLGTTIRIDQMNPSDCLELFFYHTQCEASESNIALATKIIDRLGRLPLAIDQAASYIKTRQLDLNKFENEYVNLSTTSLWSTIPQIWEYKKQVGNEEVRTALSVCTTWELSFGELEGDLSYRQSVGRLLSFMALFGRSRLSENLAIALTKQTDQPILRSEFCLKDGVWDTDKFQDTLVDLYGLSILQSIDLGSELSSFSLHPMIAEWLKLRIGLSERKRFVEAASASLNLVLVNQLKDLENCPFQVGEKLLSYIENLIESAHDLIPNDLELSGISNHALLTFARYYCHFEKFDASEALYRKVLDEYDSTLHPQDHAKLQVYYDLAFCYKEGGKFSEAIEMYERAIEGQIATLGREHPSTLRSMNGLGIANRRAQNYSRAEKTLSYVVDVGPQVLGVHNSLYLNALNNLAVVFRYQRRLTEAQTLAEQGLALKLESFGFSNVWTLDSHRCLGLILRDQGKLEEAEKIFLRNLEGLEKLLGPLHSSTLFTISLLERLYLTMGWEDKSQEMGERMQGKLGRSILQEWHFGA
jgi:tetratricopeptide (TPR) repeat protein